MELEVNEKEDEEEGSGQMLDNANYTYPRHTPFKQTWCRATSW